MKKQTLFWIGLFSLILSSCGNYEMKRRDFFALDTFCTVKVDNAHEQMLHEIEAYVTSYDSKMSRYKEGSQVSLLNRDRIVNSDELSRILKYVESSRADTGGYFDPGMAQIIDLWDFAHGGRIPDKKEICLALKVKNDTALIFPQDGQVVLKGGSGIDLGGIMKGVILDGIVNICKKNGVREAVINLGGDVALFASKRRTWSVGVQDPRGSGLWTWIRCTGREIYAVTSGDYERYFQRNGMRYHHILDPYTGYPSEGVRSLTVIAKTGMEADLLSTAWFAMGSRLKTHPLNNSAAMLALFSDGTSVFNNMERKKDEEGGVFYSVTR